MKSKKVGIFIQARVGSSRLKGKVLKKINGEYIIVLMVKRLERKFPNNVYVLTSNIKKDDRLIKILKKNKIKYFRGNEIDVLKRYYDANKKLKYQNVIRLTGDCPLIDTEIIQKTLNKHTALNKEYTSNNVLPVYPDGLDVEILKSKTLIKLNKIVFDPFLREHVTLYIKKNLKKFNVFYFRKKHKYSNLRLTLDYKEDLILIRYILKFFNKLKIEYTFNLLLKKKTN